MYSHIYFIIKKENSQGAKPPKRNVALCLKLPTVKKLEEKLKKH
jgi:hypothetical protein